MASCSSLPRTGARPQDHRFLRWSLGVAVLCGGVGLGCSRVAKPANFPELFPCEIEVKQGDGPVEGAQVVLLANDMTWSIGGLTDDKGVAVIYTHGTYPGAPAGTFKVTIIKEVREEIPNPRHQPGVDNEPTISKFKRVLPAAFASVKTTPVEVTVAKGDQPRHVVDIDAAGGGAP